MCDREKPQPDRAVLKQSGVILSFGISLLCLYLAFRGVQWTQVSGALAHACYDRLALAFIFLLPSLALAGLRWKKVINRAEIPWSQTTSAVVVGLMTNNLLPGRLGEIARVLLLGRKTCLSKAYLMATVVIDRVFDLGVLVILGLSVLAIVPVLSWMRTIALTGGVMLVGILLAIGMLLSPAGATGIAKFEKIFIPARFRPKLTGLRQEFQQGLKSIRTIHRALLIFGLSLLIWGMMGLSLFYTLLAFGLGLPFWRITLLLVVLNLGGLIPSSPGYVGTYHFLAVLALGVFGVGKEEALSFAIVNHALWYLPQTLVGLVLLWRENLTLWRLTSKLEP